MGMNWDEVPGMRGPNPRTGPTYREAHYDTFVVYRPISDCPFCTKEIAKETFVAPDGEYLCPHTRKTELDALMMRLERAEVDLKTPAQTTITKSGTVQVTLAWAVPDGPQRNEPPAPPPPQRL